jgi:hypothetical protein
MPMILSLTSALTPFLLFRAKETVAEETPASFAMSVRLGDIMTQLNGYRVFYQ